MGKIGQSAGTEHQCRLGLELTPQDHINATAPLWTTKVPSIYVAGDCVTMMKTVPMAIMMGGAVAAGIAHTLQAKEDVQE